MGRRAYSVLLSLAVLRASCRTQARCHLSELRVIGRDTSVPTDTTGLCEITQDSECETGNCTVFREISGSIIERVYSRSE